jgi:hypothetical protein
MRRGEIRWYTFAAPDQRWQEVEDALLVACGFDPRGDD